MRPSRDGGDIIPRRRSKKQAVSAVTYPELIWKPRFPHNGEAVEGLFPTQNSLPFPGQDGETLASIRLRDDPSLPESSLRQE
jgi:hypothetical protein